MPVEIQFRMLHNLVACVLSEFGSHTSLTFFLGIVAPQAEGGRGGEVYKVNNILFTIQAAGKTHAIFFWFNLEQNNQNNQSEQRAAAVACEVNKVIKS